MKISNKLRIYTIIISIIPIILLGGLSIFYGTKELEKSEKRTARANIDKGKYMLENMLESAMADVNALAVVQGYDDGNLSMVQKTYEEFASKENYSAIYFGTSTGDMYLYPLSERDNLPEDYDPRVRPWYEGAIEQNLFVSAPYTEASSGKTVITISKKVFKDSKLMGVIGFEINWRSFQKEILKMKIGNEGYLYILYKDGTTLVHQESELVGTKELMKYDFGKKIIEQKSGEIEYRWNGEKKFVIFENVEKLGVIIAGGTSFKDIRKNFNGLRNLITVIIISIILLALFSVYIFGKDIRKGLGEILEAAKNIAKGDFSKKINLKRNDEIGETLVKFNEIIEQQNSLLKGIAIKSDELYSISKEAGERSEASMTSIGVISSSVEEVEKGIETNSSSAVEAASGIEEVARSSVSVAELSQNVGSKLKETTEKAEKGKENVDVIVSTMDGIHKTVNGASEATIELSKRTENIGEFVSMIRAISGQTNLLALNAAIEAARAGEAGKGFAVVAEEVRKLAEQSQKATENIEKTIEELIVKNKEVVEKIKNGSEEVKNGVRIVKNVGRDLMIIIEAVKEVEGFSEEIIRASGEQSASTEEMAAVMNDISSILQGSESEIENVSAEVTNEVKSIEEIRGIALKLEEMAEGLNATLSHFKFRNKEEEKKVNEI